MKTRHLAPILALSSGILLAGCGGSGNSTLLGSHNPRVRELNLISNPPVAKVVVDSQTTSNSLGFGNSTDYTIFTNGNRQVSFLNTTTGATLVTEDPLLELDKYYTVVTYASHAAPTTYHEIVVTDSPSQVGPGTQLRTINLSSDIGTVDVYITAVGADISTAPPTVPNVPFGDLGQLYVPETSGTLEVRITTPGTKTVLADTQVTLNNTEVGTVYITEDASGTPQLFSTSHQF